jgi:hypothetical protein
MIWIGGAAHFTFFAIVYALVDDEAAGVTLFAAGIGFTGLIAGWTCGGGAGTAISCPTGPMRTPATMLVLSVCSPPPACVRSRWESG